MNGKAESGKQKVEMDYGTAGRRAKLKLGKQKSRGGGQWAYWNAELAKAET
jgi:hypothetical protein